jgi:hypothetical protein
VFVDQRCKLVVTRGVIGLLSGEGEQGVELRGIQIELLAKGSRDGCLFFVGVTRGKSWTLV